MVFSSLFFVYLVYALVSIYYSYTHTYHHDVCISEGNARTVFDSWVWGCALRKKEKPGQTTQLVGDARSVFTDNCSRLDFGATMAKILSRGFRSYLC